nr:thioesterase family protein [Streptomyces chrestomyceticus]
MNAYAIVSDAALATYIEEARGALIRRLADLTTERHKAAPHLVYLTVRQRIDYLLPLRWQEEPLVISLRVLRIRPSAAELLARVGCDSAPCAEARVLSTCWNTARHRPHLLTSAQRALLAHYSDNTRSDDCIPGKLR